MRVHRKEAGGPSATVTARCGKSLPFLAAWSKLYSALSRGLRSWTACDAMTANDGFEGQQGPQAGCRFGTRRNAGAGITLAKFAAEESYRRRYERTCAADGI